MINKKIEIKESNREMSLLERLIETRGLSEKDLNFNFEDIPSPYLMNDMEIAVMRIMQAIERKERIIIFGDYDADGITATTIMIKGLSDLGAQVDYYVPDRLTEGYGMNMPACKKIVQDGYDLLITVDNGIVAFDEVDYLMENGIDVIVTDHHQTQDKLPKALAVINNQREDSTYPFKDICGAFVAYKVIEALCIELGQKGKEKDYIIYAMMGTISDVMPLVNENRTLVLEGLRALKEDASLNFQYLLEAAGKEREDLTSQDVAFYIGPLINAASRVGDISYVFQLFLTDDEEEMAEASNKLLFFNERRKEIELDITRQAFAKILDKPIGKGPIVVWGEGWHKGVIGIVASRIVDQFNRPAIVLGLNNGVYSGSCRSFDGIDIMKPLNHAREALLGYGGHTGAAGLSLEEEKLEDFLRLINDYSENHFKEEDFQWKEKVDLEIYPDEISLDSFHEISCLEPFGQKNEEPVFLCKNLEVKDIRLIGQDKNHLSVLFQDEKMSNEIKGVGFFMGEYERVVVPGDKVDLILKLNKNSFKGKTSIQAMIKSMSFPKKDIGKDIEKYVQYKEDPSLSPEFILRDKKGEILPEKNDFLRVGQSLISLVESSKYKAITMSLEFLQSYLSKELGVEIESTKLFIVLDSMKEAGLIDYFYLGFNNIAFSKSNRNKVKISQTQTYRRLMKG